MVRICIAILCGMLLIGCDSSYPAGPSPTQHSAPPPTANSDLQTIRSELATVTTELENLKSRQSQDDVDRMFRTFDRIAYLQPGDTGYSTVRYDLGVLTVRLSDVAPYANGSKVSLRFGNPLASTVDGLKAKIEWGHTNENGIPDTASTKSKDFTFTESLRSGAWTTIFVVLDGVPPSELGFVRVSEVTHTGIVLSK